MKKKTDFLGDESGIFIRENKEVSVAGVQRIELYSTETVIMRMHSSYVKVRGRNMIACTGIAGEIRFKGVITSITFFDKSCSLKTLVKEGDQSE